MKIEQRHFDTYQILFVHRQDAYARQLSDGSYVSVRLPVTRKVLADHLGGAVTTGFYALDQGNTVKWIVLDADMPDGLDRLKTVWKELAANDVPSYLEKSRRGGHLWTFLESPIPASGARQLIQAATTSLRNLELYPKQDQLLPGGLGNLVRGPLGVHLLTGSRYPFVDPISSEYVSRSVAGTIEYLGEAPKLSVAKAAEIVAAHRIQQKSAPPTARRESGVASPIERAKVQLGELTAFAEQYTRLNGAGKGACPLPDHGPDSRPSFSITPDGRRWTCFHEMSGGDVLDLFMKLEGISSYKEAITRLRQSV
jgi:hypothetical protein